MDTTAAKKAPSKIAVAILKGLAWVFNEVKDHPEYIAMAAKIVATAASGNPKVVQAAGVVGEVATALEGQ